MRIHYFQHEPYEGLGMIAEWAAARGHSLTRTAFFEPDAVLPELGDYDALIVMGGSMGVYDIDRYQWITPELAHILAAIDAGKHVLGICLGAQLVAAALGARVAPHVHKEIGWFPVALTDAGATHPLLSGFNSAMLVFHWHGDRFEIPHGAQNLVSSAACDNQAFVYGQRTLALQFHLEMDDAAVQAILAGGADELEREGGGRWVQSAAAIREKGKKGVTRQALFGLLDRWARTETR
jgi:GMP synthase-like glutamine amidotransferase